MDESRRITDKSKYKNSHSKSIINSKVKKTTDKQSEIYDDSDERVNSNEESEHSRLSYVYQINDAINKYSFTIVCSTSSQEFDNWITPVNVEDILIDMNNECRTYI